MKIGTNFNEINEYLPKALEENKGDFAEVVLPEDMQYEDMVRKYRPVTKQMNEKNQELVVRGKEWWNFFADMDSDEYSDSVISFYQELNVATRLGARFFVVDVDPEEVVIENFNEAFGRAFDNSGEYQRIVFDVDFYKMTDELVENIYQSSMKFGVKVNLTDLVKTNTKSSYRLQTILEDLSPQIYMFEVDNIDLLEQKYVTKEQRNNREAEYPVSEWIDYFLSIGEEDFYRTANGFVFVPSNGASTLKDNVQRIEKIRQ